jgi:hypothetical protein
VRPYAVPTDESPPEWLVFGRDGHPISRIGLPVRLTPMWIDRSGILGVEEDADDVEHLVNYDVVR